MISIIIPTYNRGNLIKKSIESILMQTYKDFELIIVDDNSSDNTESIVKSIEDNRIKYIRLNKNVGANKARNIGIENSLGEYIAFNDSDDEWKSNKLEIQLQTLIDTNADLVFCSYARYDNGNITIAPNKNVDIENIFYELLKENLISTQTILAKRECLIAEKFDEQLPRFQDWDLVIRLAKKYKIEFVKSCLVDVYLQNDSISKNYKKAKIALDIMRDKYKEDLILNKQASSRWYRMSMQYSSNLKERTIYLLRAIKNDPINIRNLASFIKHTIK